MGQNDDAGEPAYDPLAVYGLGCRLGFTQGSNSGILYFRFIYYFRSFGFRVYFGV